MENITYYITLVLQNGKCYSTKKKTENNNKWKEQCFEKSRPPLVVYNDSMAGNKLIYMIICVIHYMIKSADFILTFLAALHAERFFFIQVLLNVFCEVQIVQSCTVR